MGKLKTGGCLRLNYDFPNGRDLPLIRMKYVNQVLRTARSGGVFEFSGCPLIIIYFEEFLFMLPLLAD